MTVTGLILSGSGENSLSSIYCLYRVDDALHKRCTRKKDLSSDMTMIKPDKYKNEMSFDYQENMKSSASRPGGIPRQEISRPPREFEVSMFTETCNSYQFARLSTLFIEVRVICLIFFFKSKLCVFMHSIN